MITKLPLRLRTPENRTTHLNYVGIEIDPQQPIRDGLLLAVWLPPLGIADRARALIGPAGGGVPPLVGGKQSGFPRL